MSALTKKDFQSDQDIKWCPGCGDYAILSQVQKLMPELGIPKENIVFISGIGCSSRFPYYMDTYGFHTIHGRAPAIAAGLKETRPDLQVWIVTGDGDALSIGGNHFIHTLRRNMDVKILLFNNRVYGLTKGQYSPTSAPGMHSKSSPYGSVDRAFNPIQLALGAGATFVARTIDVEVAHLLGVLRRMAAHKGSAFVEIYQNCVVFNDGVYANLTDKSKRDDTQLRLEHGKPLRFGKHGLRLRGLQPEVVTIGEGVSDRDLIQWDEQAPPALAFALAETAPELPTPIGVFRAVSVPAHHELEQSKTAAVIDKMGSGDLEQLFGSGDTWTVG